MYNYGIIAYCIVSIHRIAINHNLVVFYLELLRPEPNCTNDRFAYHFDPCYAFQIELCSEFTSLMRNKRQCISLPLPPLASYFEHNVSTNCTKCVLKISHARSYDTGALLQSDASSYMYMSCLL